MTGRMEDGAHVLKHKEGSELQAEQGVPGLWITLSMEAGTTASFRHETYNRQSRVQDTMHLARDGFTVPPSTNEA